MDNRRATQINQGFPVIVKDDRTGYQYPAAMHECAKGGLYLESNYAPRPGSTFQILFDGRKMGAAPCTCPAV